MKSIYSFVLVALMAVACGSNETESQANNEVPEKAKQITGSGQVPVKPSHPQSDNGHAKTGDLDWLTFEEAIAANAKSPKPILVDVYTSWCGWCKVMDRKTFTDPQVQAYIKENFYPVKFDAEQKESIQFNGKEYNFVQGGRRGHNQLAAHLLNGRLGYPSFAFLNSDYRHLHITVGYKDPQQFMGEMQKAISQTM